MKVRVGRIDPCSILQNARELNQEQFGFSKPSVYLADIQLFRRKMAKSAKCALAAGSLFE